MSNLRFKRHSNAWITIVEDYFYDYRFDKNHPSYFNDDDYDLYIDFLTVVEDKCVEVFKEFEKEIAKGFQKLEREELE